MTFLEEIKEELAEERFKKPCCVLSELRALLIFGGAPYEGGMFFGTMSTECAKRFAAMLKKACGLEAPQRLDESASGYKFFLPKEAADKLKLDASGEFISETEDLEKEPCCRRAFLKGAFLASSSASNPEKAYRIEIFSENGEAVKKIHDILTFFGAEAALTRRKSNAVVYLNNSESVSDALKIMETTKALFRLLDAKVLKDKRNSANRVVNCEMANTDRTADTSFKHRAAIKKIEKTMGLESLKPKLYEAARLRLENEDLSIASLALLADPPVSKGAMYARLEKIARIARELGGE